MVMRLPTASRNALASALADLADAGSGPGTIKIYTGAQPASANSAATGTLLLTFTLVDPAYLDPIDGIADLDADPDLTAMPAASGTAGWGRLADSAGNTVYDGSAGLASTVPTPQFVLNSVAITVGNQVTLLSGTLTQPSGE